MKRTKEELIAAFTSFLGENQSDEAINLLEDINDSFEEAEIKPGEDWETKYNELDAEWRARYIARFKGNTDGTPEVIDDLPGNDDNPDEAPTTYEELFTTED